MNKHDKKKIPFYSLKKFVNNIVTNNLCKEGHIVYCDTTGAVIYFRGRIKHRIDGPAVIRPLGNVKEKEYFLDGKKISRTEQEFLYDLMRLKGACE